MTTTPEVPVPARMLRLHRDKHDRPVPWFVHWRPDGTPDFRVVGAGKVKDAVRFGMCWVCGQRLGRIVAFVIGPMCSVNRVSGDPPTHRDCGVYSARACPFLATPAMQRRESGLPEGYVVKTGSIPRNPGVALVWVTREWEIVNAAGAGRTVRAADVLFRLGDPIEALWFAHGRAATRAEVQESIDSGLPILRAEADKQGVGDQLDADYEAARALLPPG